MSDNSNLINAQKAKRDEFYTSYVDIQDELQHHTSAFNGKIVLCNCDNPAQSAFWKYFHLQFAHLNLKKLIAVYWDANAPVYKTTYCGGEDENVDAGVKTLLKGDGDFRSAECQNIIEECDIVCTNPPFSLFREYLEVLEKHTKQFLIIGNLNALTYKHLFHLFRTNKIRLGYSGRKSMMFRMADDYDLCGQAFLDEDGYKYIKLSSCVWYTNLPVSPPAPLELTRTYNPMDFPCYDNYNAINIKHTKDIPYDYNGDMGVPISFVANYNPNQFEIVGMLTELHGEDFIQGTPTYTDAKHKHSTCAVLNGKRQYPKLIIRKKPICNEIE